MSASAPENVQRIYDALKTWTSFGAMEELLSGYYASPRSQKEIGLHLEMKLKKLTDEVWPVQLHLRQRGFKGQVRFAMSDAVPDCEIRESEDSEIEQIEVTIANGRERAEIGRHLQRTGSATAFLGLSAEASGAEYLVALRDRDSFGTPEFLAHTKRGIACALTAKNDEKFRH